MNGNEPFPPILVNSLQAISLDALSNSTSNRDCVSKEFSASTRLQKSVNRANYRLIKTSDRQLDSTNAFLERDSLILHFLNLRNTGSSSSLGSSERVSYASTRRERIRSHNSSVAAEVKVTVRILLTSTPFSATKRKKIRANA